jgi:septum formation protein
MKVLLASSSPRRSEILGQLGVDFRVVPQDSDESATRGGPRGVARANARSKAHAARLPARTLKSIVVGVDTIVVLGDRVLGKPRDARESARMIASLSGRTHEVISGIHLELAGTGRSATLAASTRVTFRRLSRREIRWYVGTGEGKDKAGAYGIQGLGAVLVERIHGDYFNVVGFPVQAFLRGLARLGLSLPDVMARPLR